MFVEKEKVNRYKEAIQSLLKYMVDMGCNVKPYPKFRLVDKNQGDILKIKTGYYDPQTKTVVVFTNGRAFKDCMRSIAHELIHHSQCLQGRLSTGSYEGDRIVDDNRLKKLEEEAYLKGNIYFRSWTETVD